MGGGCVAEGWNERFEGKVEDLAMLASKNSSIAA
jgi:hypothetical protein